MAIDSKIQVEIPKLKPGESITAFFILRKKELKTKKDGMPYIAFELGNATGRINATCWENAKSIHKNLDHTIPVKVKGSVIQYNDSLQIAIEKIRNAIAQDKITLKSFLPQTSIDIEDMQKHLQEIIESVANPFLFALLEQVWLPSEEFKLFTEAPGGKLWHHAYLGGLMEHTLSVVNICEHLTKLYSSLNRDLLMTGAILHDIGKIYEYEYSLGYIDYSDKGRLLGHISIGAQIINSMINKLKSKNKFSETLKNQLLHLILSHQGKQEHGTPVVPKTMEAMALYYADELDSKLNALKHVIERDQEPERHWSKFVPPLDRFIFLGDDRVEI